MRVDLFDYDLPNELIASRPAQRRDGGRLLVMHREGIEHGLISELADRVAHGTLVVVNDTRVVPARLLGHKHSSGGRVELLLLEKVDAGGEKWRALGRASKPLRPGTEIVLDPERLRATVVGRVADGVLEVVLTSPSGLAIEDAIDAVGHVPLPPYVGRPDDEEDRERYQTVFARVPGAIAAPTAGLHLTSELMTALRARSCDIASVTLHVGLGTFQPVTASDLDDHPMHEERFSVPEPTAVAIEHARARGSPVLAIGTTVVRALESVAEALRPGHVRAAAGLTRLLIQPGHGFRVVDRLMTNFHLPRSTLLALVSAFAGRERVLAAYHEAIRARYRFFSYGDAMLLDRGGGAGS